MKILLIYFLLIIAAVPAVPQQFSVSSDYFNVYKSHSATSSMNALYTNTEFRSLFLFNNTRLSVNIGTTNSDLSWNTSPVSLQNKLLLKQNYSSVSVFSSFHNIFIDSKITVNNFQQKYIFDYTRI